MKAEEISRALKDMQQKQIGYFYLYKRCLLGEIHSPGVSPVFDGHYQFWTSEAPKVFCTPDTQTVLMASYGCDRGRITFHDLKQEFLKDMKSWIAWQKE